ncbi:uncharacterized protein [Amphiura filiformis]|uniref:uncharacterized protein n=1 Tax=Amphiura filiformis TaxID=82378 RepID=UPI003B222BCF
MADIDILGIDELLIIFNLLSLYDKLMARRVCKKWYDIVRDTHAWKVIDFRAMIDDDTAHLLDGYYKRYVAEPGQNVFTFREHLHDVKRWEFPRNPSDVLSFLGLFAGVALQEIYLTAMSVDIMDFLRRYCPNVVMLDFCSCYVRLEEPRGLQGIDIPPIDRMDIDDDIKKKLYVPFKLKRLGLTGVKCSPIPEERKAKLNERILSCVANYDCSELQSICLCNFELTSKGMQKLVEIPSLREIELSNCRYYYNDRSLDYNYRSLDDILTNSIGGLKTLTCLRIHRLNTKPRAKYKYYHDYTTCRLNFLGCIGEWEYLQELSLIDVIFSDEAFEKMIPGLLNLKRLEIQGRHSYGMYMLTPRMVTIIGNQCRKIESLQLRWLEYTDESLMSLCHHPTLEVLEVQYYNYSKIAETDWLHKVFTILETLSKIKHVKLWGKNISKIYNEGTFPIIQAAEIEAIEYGKQTHEEIQLERAHRNQNFLKKSFKRMFKR